MDEHHYYIGGRLMSAVIAYNTDLVSEEDAPRTWDDLLDPRWNGQIVMTDPGSSGSIKYFVGALMNSPAYGTAYFERLRENGCMLESNSTATHLQVAHGRTPWGSAWTISSATWRSRGAYLLPPSGEGYGADLQSHGTGSWLSQRAKRSAPL